MLKNISRDKWLKILKNMPMNDENFINYLKNNEEKILDILLVDSEKMLLDDKRREYVRFILSQSLGKIEKNEDDAINKILEISNKYDYNILTFGKKLDGSTLIVYEFGDKIIKFGRYFYMYKELFILQPEFKLDCGEKKYMTIFEKLPKVFDRKDFDIAQKMYNKVRDKGYVWFDAIGNNIGISGERLDENDDGLRIIDADYIESISEIYDRVRYEHKDLYEQYGDAAYTIYLKQYINQKGYFSMEEKYQEYKKEMERLENNKDLSKNNVESVSFLKKLKQEIMHLFKNDDNQINNNIK